MIKCLNSLTRQAKYTAELRILNGLSCTSECSNCRIELDPERLLSQVFPAFVFSLYNFALLQVYVHY